MLITDDPELDLSMGWNELVTVMCDSGDDPTPSDRQRMTDLADAIVDSLIAITLIESA